MSSQSEDLPDFQLLAVRIRRLEVELQAAQDHIRGLQGARERDLKAAGTKVVTPEQYYDL